MNLQIIRSAGYSHRCDRDPEVSDHEASLGQLGNIFVLAVLSVGLAVMLISSMPAPVRIVGQSDIQSSGLAQASSAKVKKHRVGKQKATAALFVLSSLVGAGHQSTP